MNEQIPPQAQEEPGEVEIKDFSGLSLKVDKPNQPNNVFSELDNFDLYVAGSIRKVKPLKKYNEGPFGPGANKGFISSGPVTPVLPSIPNISAPSQFGWAQTGNASIFGVPVLPLVCNTPIPTGPIGDTLIAVIVVQGYGFGVGAFLNPLDAIPGWDIEISVDEGNTEGYVTVLRRIIDGTEGGSVNFVYSGPAFNFGGFTMAAQIFSVHGASASTPVNASTIDGHIAIGSNYFLGCTTSQVNCLLLIGAVGNGNRVTPADIPGTTLELKEQMPPGPLGATLASWSLGFVGPGPTGTFGSASGWNNFVATFVIAVGPETSALGDLEGFPVDANGIIVPAPIIKGLGTHITAPMGILLDNTGKLWVADRDSNANGAVIEYDDPAMATIGTTPTRYITGVTTGLNAPRDVAIGDGRVWVCNRGGHDILAFLETDTGNVAPSNVISGGLTTLNDPRSVAVSVSRDIFVADSGDKIKVWNSLSPLGNVAPDRVIAGPTTQLDGPFAVRISPDGFLWVLCSPSGNPAFLLQFNLTDNGDVAPQFRINSVSFGHDCEGLAFLPNGNIFIADFTNATLWRVDFGTGMTGVTFPGGITAVPDATITGWEHGPLGVGVDQSPLPPAGAPKILNFINYYAQPNRNDGPILRLLGVGDDGNIYNLLTGVLWASLQPLVGTSIAAIPSMDALPNYFVPYNPRGWQKNTTFMQFDSVLKYDASDGNLYVFFASIGGVSGAIEPLWTHDAPVNDGTVLWLSAGIPNSERFLENALIVTVPGFKPILCIEWQYDPNDGAETPKVFVQTSGVGVSPTTPTEIESVEIIKSLNGYVPLSGRAHTYTWYDPHTLHESSPAPIAGRTKITQIDKSNMTATVNGSILLPIPADATGQAFRSYQVYYGAIPLAEVQAAIAAGFEQMYFYETKDGGATFFRATQLFDDLGNVISNSDGSVSLQNLAALSIEKIWTDYFPLPTPQNAEPSCRIYEGSGPVNLVPDPQNFGAANWTVKSGNDLEVVPGDAPSGNAAIEYIGTGAAGTNNKLQSSRIPVIDLQDYYFQAYIDASALIGGIARWEVLSGDNSVHYLDLAQPPGDAGIVSNTFNKPADGHHHVRIRVHCNNANVGADDVVVFSDPLLEEGTTLSAVPINYPTDDPALVIPAPAALSQGPPPVGLAGALYQSSYFVVEKGTFRTWMSNPGDVQSYGANAFLPLDATAGAPVLELVSVFDRLILGKQKSISQVTGNNPTDFQPRPVDPQHGVLASRSSIPIGNSLVSLLATGLSLVGMGLSVPTPETVEIGFNVQAVVGDPVKPLTDTILAETKNVISKFVPCPAVDNSNNFYMFAFATQESDTPFNDKLLLDTLTHRGPSPWSTFSAFPITDDIVAKLITLKEVIIVRDDPTKSTVGVLASFDDGNIYEFWAGPYDDSYVATAVTYPLPDLKSIPFEVRDTMKIVRELWVEGEGITQNPGPSAVGVPAISDWEFAWSTDYGATFNDLRPLLNRNKIGNVGRQIIFKFVHRKASSIVPLLSYMKFNWGIEGDAAGGTY